jgi:predicted phosphodiesterase
VLRVALISDLHGNAIALREVLRSIDERGADRIVCLGDVATLGVAPGEVIDALMQRGCPCIMGNHDDYVLDPSRVDGHTGTGVILEAIGWCREQLSQEQIEFIRGFETDLELVVEDGVRLKLFHGSPSSNMVDLLAETPADEFDAQLGPDRAPVMAGGHTHLQMLRQHRGTLVVNPGSVGAPFAELPRGAPPRILDHAEYATVEVRGRDVGVTLHRIALDRGELERAALASTSPMRLEWAAAYR